MFQYFYNEIFRKVIIGFGNLFNEIQIKHVNDSGKVVSAIKVPLAYGPTQKFLARLEQEPNLNKPIQITLPRMSFELVGLSYDSSRKVTTTQKFVAPNLNSGDVMATYMPVPYNMDFELSIMTKLNDDMLQIIEQILPYFQPSYNLSINMIDLIGEKRDVPITLNSIAMEDNYEGDFTDRRALIYTLRFTAKTYIFGPSTKVDQDIITKSSIGYVSGDNNSTSRDLVYSTTPKATTSYVDNIVTTLSSDVNIEDSVIKISDSSSIEKNSYIVIDNETLKVVSKDGNNINVSRGEYGTSITIHTLGSAVKLLTAEDDSNIKYGDDFGFNLDIF